MAIIAGPGLARAHAAASIILRRRNPACLIPGISMLKSGERSESDDGFHRWLLKGIFGWKLKISFQWDS